MEKKKLIIFMVIGIILFSLLCVLLLQNNNKTKASNNELLSKMTVIEENILSINNEVTLEGKIKNNNNQDVKIKGLHIILSDEYGKAIKQITIKINKIVKANKSIKFSETVKIKSNRTFTDYEILL